VIAIAGVLVVVTAVGGWLGWRVLQRTDYEDALAMMPRSTLRATYTDWAAVRRLADGPSSSSSAGSGEIDEFLSRAYDQELTTTSAVVDATAALDEHYGFSPIDATWESYAQSRKGAVVAMRLPDNVDLTSVEDRLDKLGYQAPADGPGSGGVWAGTDELVVTIDAALTPVFTNLVVLPEEGLVLLSDDAGYLSDAAEVATGESDGLRAQDGVPALASAASDPGRPVTAVLFADDFACEALSMGSTDEEDQARADELVEGAGGVSPVAGLVVAMYDDRSLVVGMHFESSSQASKNLRSRAELAVGEAVGQGGEYPERFRVVEARSDGEEVVMDLEPVDEALPVFSDLTQGPVLFATC
jgi:hypothetical protein